MLTSRPVIVILLTLQAHRRRASVGVKAKRYLFTLF
jgi:hypothetical protein